MDDQENKSIEEKQDTQNNETYKKIFPAIALLYIASIAISFLELALNVTYSEVQNLTFLVSKTLPTPIISNIAKLYIITAIVSCEILRRASSMHIHNKAPNIWYSLILVILAIIGWFFCLLVFIFTPFILNIPKY